MSDNRIAHQPEWDAVNAFDAENNVEPFITIADRIVSKYRLISGANDLAMEISHALEDAYSLGERRGPLIAKVRTPPQRDAWDHPSNRSYEPVEKRAAEIYATFGYDGPGKKPAWVPGGNSLKQDLARMDARKELRAAGHAQIYP